MLAILFWTFFKIAAVTPGGGLVMLPLLQEEFETRRKWISSEDMVDVVAMVQSTPGIIAVNMAVMVGTRIAGVPGALVAVAGAVLPSFILILGIAALFHSLGSGSTAVANAFAGIRAAVCALILLSCAKMARSVLRGGLEVALAVAAFLALVGFGFNAAALIGLSAAVGILVFLPPWRGLRRRKPPEDRP